VTWDGYGNNAQCLAQTIVMTPNQTLSIPNALRTARPDDYYQNVVTIDWPDGAYGQPLPIETSVSRAVAFKDGGHIATAKEFVSFLIGEGWLAHYLDFAGERILPPMPALLQAPFWLDPGDPHRMRSAMQLLTRPRAGSYVSLSGDLRHSKARARGGLAEDRPPRRDRRDHPRAGGRRGDRADQRHAERVAAHARRLASPGSALQDTPPEGGRWH
jgi:hypothetical protein